MATTTILNKDQMYRFFSGTSRAVVDKYFDGLNKTCEKFEINNPRRVSMFMAQLSHESNGLQKNEEGLYYSVKRLLEVFPRYFKKINPANYAGNPQKFANYVYANRMGNGPENSGDGFKFHGRGLIQLTGEDNYERFARDMGMSINDAVSYITTPEGSCMSAGWFWSVNRLNQYADRRDIDGCSRVINGGSIGLDERRALYNKARVIFGG
jgi:putative chitinase